METLLSPEEIVRITSAATHNDLLPDSLQTTVQLIITDAERSISRLDDEIVRIQATLDDLRSQRTGHIARIQRYQTVIAPHRRLPVEMLEEVFTMCNPEPVAIPVELEKAPWMLGRVCSKWRRVVLSAPMLWSNIEMDSSAHLVSGHTRMLEALLLRSAHTPASVRIAVHCHETNESAMEELDKLFTSCASRLRSLRVDGPYSCIKTFLSLPAGSIESVQMLELFGLDNADSQTTLSVVRGACNLRQLVVVHLEMLSTVAIQNIPFHQLTHLCLCHYEHPFPPDIGFDILSQCTSLVDCKLEITVRTGQVHPHDRRRHTVVTLENLKVFQFFTDAPLNALQWFENLRFPNLVELWYWNYTDDSIWPSGWTSGVCHSSHLEKLELKIPISVVDLEKILAAMPLLRTLEILKGMVIPETLLTRMSHGDLVPRLSSLQCTIDSERALATHLDMLENRRYGQDSVADISTVVIEATVNPNWGATIDRMNQLVNNGWNIELR